MERFSHIFAYFVEVGYIRSIDYFSLSIGDDRLHRLYISLVIWHRGISLEFFTRREVLRLMR